MPRSQLRKNLLILALGLAAALDARAVTVYVTSISATQVQIIVDGKAVRTLRVGETSPEGVKLLDPNTILVNEYPTVLEEMTITGPGRYFGNPSAGGLGWGMGAALGAKLASPDKTVICAVGDGAYMFGNPTAGHFVSEAMRLPVLFIIANNARWAAVHRSTLSTYPKGFASQTKQPPFATLEPSPRFEHVIQASGGHGERVTEPKDLLPALERALKVVKEEKRQALLNVCIEAGYVKTS